MGVRGVAAHAQNPRQSRKSRVENRDSLASAIAVTPERIAEDGNPIEEFLCYGNCQAVMRQNEALKSELERLGAENEALRGVAAAASDVRLLFECTRGVES
jgi:hypothetical protein